jgi:hypothetical protein
MEFYLYVLHPLPVSGFQLPNKGTKNEMIYGLKEEDREFINCRPYVCK